MTAFDKFSELDPAKLLREIDDEIDGDVFDQYSLLAPERARQQLANEGIVVSNAAMLDPARFVDEVEAALDDDEGGGGDLPLDAVSGAVAAYGQRALSTGMLGAALYTIRENSGDMIQTFNSDPTTGDAPSTDITTFLNGADGYVDAWVDQSGAGLDGVMATLARQPRWMPSRFGAVPSLVFDETLGHFLATAGDVTLPSGEYTVFAVVMCPGCVGPFSDILGINYRTDTTEKFDISFTDNENFPNGVGVDATSDDYDETEAYGFTRNNPGIFNNAHVFEFAWSASEVNILIDGVACITTSEGYGTVGSITGRLAIGRDDAVVITAGASLNGDLAELLIYPTLLSAGDRLSVRQNMAAYHSIALS